MFRNPEHNRFYSPPEIAPPIDPAPTPAPEGIPPPRRGGTECAFCECQIAPDGGLIKTSPRARQLAKADDVISDLKDMIKSLEKDLAEVKKKFGTGANGKSWPKFLG